MLVFLTIPSVFCEIRKKSHPSPLKEKMKMHIKNGVSFKKNTKNRVITITIDVVNYKSISILLQGKNKLEG